MMSDYEEDLGDSQPSQQRTYWPNLWLGHIAQNQQIHGQLQVESLRKLHHSLMCQILGSNMRS